MLKEGGKEVKEHNQFIDFPKVFVVCFQKNSPWVPSDLIDETYPWQSLDRVTKMTEFRGDTWKSLSPMKMGDHSPNSVRLPQ